MPLDISHLTLEGAKLRHIESLSHEGIADFDDAISNLPTVLEKDNINRSLFGWYTIETMGILDLFWDIIEIGKSFPACCSE
jgi:hypothetical protein